MMSQAFQLKPSGTRSRFHLQTPPPHTAPYFNNSGSVHLIAQVKMLSVTCGTSVVLTSFNSISKINLTPSLFSPSLMVPQGSLYSEMPLMTTAPALAPPAGSPLGVTKHLTASLPCADTLTSWPLLGQSQCLMGSKGLRPRLLPLTLSFQFQQHQPHRCSLFWPHVFSSSRNLPVTPFLPGMLWPSPL